MTTELRATAANGDIWEGGRDGEWWMYLDHKGRLYESKEVPAYRIVMDKACIVNGAITPISPPAITL